MRIRDKRPHQNGSTLYGSLLSDMLPKRPPSSGGTIGFRRRARSAAWRVAGVARADQRSLILPNRGLAEIPSPFVIFIFTQTTSLSHTKLIRVFVRRRGRPHARRARAHARGAAPPPTFKFQINVKCHHGRSQHHLAFERGNPNLSRRSHANIRTGSRGYKPDFRCRARIDAIIWRCHALKVIGVFARRAAPSKVQTQTQTRRCASARPASVRMRSARAKGSGSTPTRRAPT